MFIGAMAGVSALWQLFGGSGTQQPNQPAPPTASSAAEPSSGPVNVTGGSEPKLGSDLKALLLHLQSAAGSGAASDNTAQVADDLRNLLADVRKGGHGHGRPDRGHGPAGTEDPVQGLASALTAYAKQLRIASAPSSGGPSLTA